MQQKDSSIPRSVWRKSIRQDAVMSACQGIDINRMKLLAFALGSFYAGIAGAIRAHYVGFISPETFVLDMSLFLSARLS